jgi:CRISPR/Cas system-associated exonuclease Cas4 (RecB family)
MGWDQPFLPAAAKWLQEHCLQDGLGSAKEVLILVSGQAIARRMQSIFVREARKRGRAVELPWIGTPSRLFRNLIGLKNRIADPTTTLLTATSVLKEMPPNTIAPIVGPRRPAEDDFVAWSKIARHVCDAMKTVSGGGLSLDRSTWPECARVMLTDSAMKRFDLLKEIQSRVQTIFDKEGLHLFELQQLELLNNKQELELGSIQRVVVVGASDLAGIATQLLDRMSQQGVAVDVLIRAPESESAGFDSHGCIDTSYWIEVEIDVEDSSIKVAGSPSAQAVEVVRALESFGDSVTTDQITISSTDEQLIPIIQRHVQGHGVRTRFAGGIPVLQTQESLLLSSVAEFVSTRSYDSYASFVRHPDIVDLLNIEESVFKKLSKYSMNVIPKQVSTKQWFNPKETREDFSGLGELHKQVFDLLAPCFKLERKSAQINQSSTVIREFLLTVYGGESLDRSDRKLLTLQKIFGVVDRFDSISATIQAQLGPLRLSEVIRVLLSQLDGSTIPEMQNLGAIDTVGWLEAIAIETPHLVVVGMSADLVGGNDPSDAFFPDSLRDALGLETLHRRMARDAHAIVAMQKSRSREGSIRWIVGRKNTDGDPLTPSPLLMRCSDADQLAERSRKLVVPIDREKPEVPPQYKRSAEGRGIQFPNPNDIQHAPLNTLSVTAFKDYIACPYRFWLKHVMKLHVAEEGNTELDAKLFGSFVHSVLQRFGENKSVNSSSNAESIEKSLFRDLDRLVEEQLGSMVSGKIRVQIELSRYRLREFAKRQALSAASGWKIVCSERKANKVLEVDGSPFKVRGVIDRIDVHEDGRIRVLDYKTGSTSPNAAHFNKSDSQWIDYQLPLYRSLLTEIKELDDYNTSEGNISLGYFKVGDQEASSGIDLLNLPDEAMASVDGAIELTIQSILNCEYNEQPTEPAPKYSDTYSWICQDDSVVEESNDDG